MLARHVRGPEVLEIGAANGRFVHFLENMGFSYTGLDLSKIMLTTMDNFNGSSLIQADGERIPLAPESFDSAICLHTFHFLPHPKACIQECHRVLKFRGRLVLIFELDTWLRRVVVATNIFESNQFYYRTSEVASMIQDHGLEVVAQGLVLKLPIEAYRKLPFIRIQRMIDVSSLPGVMGTLAYVVAEKRHWNTTPTQVLAQNMQSSSSRGRDRPATKSEPRDMGEGRSDRSHLFSSSGR